MTGYRTVQTSGGVKHGLHAILTVCTCGLWAPVWLLVAIFTPKKTKVVVHHNAQTGAVHYPQANSYHAAPVQNYGYPTQPHPAYQAVDMNLPPVAESHRVSEEYFDEQSYHPWESMPQQRSGETERNQ